MSTGTVPLISKSDPEHTNILLKQLLDCIQRCQRRYGGKNVLATEFDSCVAGLCLCLEGVFLHGLRTKPIQNPLKQVSEIVAQSLNIRQETISFWAFLEKHLTKHERERFNILKHIWTDFGKCRAWIRAALNEKSLERYFHIVLSDKDILSEHYEPWALLRDEDQNSMLSNMAAGLGSILFAISIDKIEFNVAIVPRASLIHYQNEPIITVPVPANKDRKSGKNKRRVARQIISFDDDDSMFSASVPSVSGSSTCSDNSIGNQHKNDKSRGTMDFQKSEILREKGELEANGIKQNQEWDAISDNKSDESGQSDIAITLMENSGSRQTFQSNMPGTLTPVNQNTIGELTPVSVENFNESVEISDDILEVPTDISAVLTVVEHKNQEELRRRDERITLLSKENQALKEQVSKYVSAIKMLKRDDHDLIDGLEGLDIETQPDYKGEARMFEQKLIQVAEMHAELMDFNVMLQKSLQQKDTLLDRLKEELEVLKGPIALQELESEGNRGCINIWIPSAFLTGTGSSAHHVYQLFLRVGNDEWNIYRRYAQFYALHTDLKKLDPAVNSFDFPPKKSIGKKDSALVEERRKRLQSYLRKVIAHWPELANCNNRFLLEQHLAFFKDQQEDEAKRNMFSSRKSGNPGNSSGL